VPHTTPWGHLSQSATQKKIMGTGK
jgi:hypothetical protein